MDRSLFCQPILALIVALAAGSIPYVSLFISVRCASANRQGLAGAIDLMLVECGGACSHRGARMWETGAEPSLRNSSDCTRTLSRIAFTRSYDEPGKPPSSRRHRFLATAILLQKETAVISH